MILVSFYEIFNSGVFFVFSILMLTYVYFHWKDEHKKAVIYSELCYGIFFIFMGVYSLIYLDEEGISEIVQLKIQRIMFYCFLAILTFLLPMNIWKEAYKVKKNPELKAQRQYSCFLDNLNEKYDSSTKNDDVVKDISRKALHIVILFVIVGINEYATSNEIMLREEWGLTPYAFRNTLFIIVGSAFIFMFTLEGLYRLHAFHCLPNWARWWMDKSLDPKTEGWTLISSVPFLQTLMLFIFAPVPVLYSAMVVSCVSDSVASIVGKSFGRHKLKFGLFPNKSIEGAMGGALATYLGIIIVLTYNPIVGINVAEMNLIALITAAIFILIDAYGKFIADNVLNTALPALFIWAMMGFQLPTPIPI